ncbi:MAG: transcription termination/antitermination protein NusG [Hydrogenophilales bacterium CG17_big_fil_post_rev_8_21_14_2_50_63_12]|nr:MAG: transcription termination/antitermination protein NusG [Hydrogenophilales bacterium CG17_big_fil_post_rev_8_21_14_2_50_63_12]PIX95753.1 MAG: transcription termination/antitermination protein NusG [Hydrogenophilales bacterium CG_4_10_14_3_um_filter_63_21]PJB02573.1 MAG: transcription termination/antitermination protein NusG [Hydrogenophilales bacterium CG_4_9_14_3_um_filter_63_34]
MAMQWYVVHAYSGFEKSVMRALKERVERSGMQDKFGEIMVPVEEVVEMKGGKKMTTERKFFPGYVLVQMEMDDDTWHLVKSTAKVTGFVGGSGNKPAPISEKEVEAIMQQMQEGVEKPKHKITFEIGEVVRVVDGPFNDFNGIVEEVNYEKNKLRVSVTIFGRGTPVELDFAQIEKA